MNFLHILRHDFFGRLPVDYLVRLTGPELGDKETSEVEAMCSELLEVLESESSVQDWSKKTQARGEVR